MTQCSGSHESWPSRLLKTHIYLGGNVTRWQSHTAVGRQGIRQGPDFISQLQAPSPLRAGRPIIRHQQERHPGRTTKDGVPKVNSTSCKVLAATEDERVQLRTIHLEVLLAKRTNRISVPGKRHGFDPRRIYEKFYRHPARASRGFPLLTRSRRERHGEEERRRGRGAAQTPPDSGLTGGAIPGTSEETGSPLDKSVVSQENRRDISAGTKHPEGTYTKSIVKKDIFKTLCRSRVSFIIIGSIMFRCLCFRESVADFSVFHSPAVHKTHCLPVNLYLLRNSLTASLRLPIGNGDASRAVFTFRLSLEGKINNMVSSSCSGYRKHPKHFPHFESSFSCH